MNIVPDGHERARRAIEAERARERGDPEPPRRWWVGLLRRLGLTSVGRRDDDDRAPPDALY